MSAKRSQSGVERSAGVRLTFDGEPVVAHPGETVAAALAAAGVLWLRSSPTAHTPRGAFCHMGVCQECVVRIDGELTTSCLVAVRDGMRVESGRHR